MAVKPDDPYNSVPTEAPETGMPNDTLSVRANPADFGSQVGEAVQGLGQQISKSGDELFDYLTKRQGMINETLATDAETDYATQAGKVLGAYKTKEGLEAVAATDDTISQLRTIRQNVFKSMPNPAAARAFNLLASRREAYALQDISLYSATQVKAADNKSAQASVETSINQASDPSVATNSQQFSDLKANIKFQTARVLNNQGYGVDGGTGMKQDPRTGDVTFNDTPSGQQAAAVYKQFFDKAIGQAYENKYKVLLDDPRDGSATKAYNSYLQEADSIPIESRARIAASLTGPVRSAQTRVVAQNAIGTLDQGYLNDISGRITGKYNGNQLVDTFIDQESGNGKTSTNLGQIQPGTWATYAKPGEDINNAVDNKHVTARVLDDLQKKYGGDPERVAVAYFSGEGNVAPAGSPTPWKQDFTDKNGKSTSSYVNDIIDKLNVKSSIPYINRADYYKQNFSDAVDKSYSDYIDLHPGDIPGAEQARAQTEQHINDVIRTQAHEDSADRDLISRAGRGEFNNDNPYTTEQQFLTGPPEVKAAWQRFQINDPLGYQTYVTRTLPALSRGPSTTYGTDFWKYAQQALAGNQINTTHLPVGGDKNSPITPSGLKEIEGFTKGHNTPEDTAFSKQELQFLTHLHNEALPPIFFNGGKHSASLENYFTGQLPTIFKLVEAGKAQGKTAAQLFSPTLGGKDNPDYVGNHFEPPKMSTIQDEFKKTLFTTLGSNTPAYTPSGPAYQDKDIKSVDDVKRLWQQGKIKNREELKGLLEKHGFAQSSGPQVPVGQ